MDFIFLTSSSCKENMMMSVDRRQCRFLCSLISSFSFIIIRSFFLYSLFSFLISLSLSLLLVCKQQEKGRKQENTFRLLIYIKNSKSNVERKKETRGRLKRKWQAGDGNKFMFKLATIQASQPAFMHCC